MDVDWIACVAGDDDVTGWPVAADGRPGPSIVVADLTGLRAAFGPAPIVACGFPVERRKVPCAPLPEILPDAGGARLIAGLIDPQFGAETAGAEAYIAGFLTRHKDWDGVIHVAGPSHLWAHISAGEVVSFQCFASGRLAVALAVQGPWSDAGFDDALDVVMSRPERLAAVLAQAGGQGALWGALLGAEMAASRAYWLGQRVALIGEGDAIRGLKRALLAQGVPVQTETPLQVLIAGLDAARRLEQN